MNRAESLQIIRDAFSHIEVLAIVVEHEPLVEEEVAKVVVRKDQLEDALRGNGYHPRQAAIRSGMTVEVVLRDEIDHPL